MKIKQVAELSPLDRFVYWIAERESIRLKRLSGLPKPWTNDEILQRYRFCNVRRMDDKVSQWLLKNWYEPYQDHPNMLIACVLARNFNLPAALETIGFPELWQPKHIKRTLRTMKAKGNCIFNGAYIVRGNDGVDKIASVIDYTVKPLVKSPLTVYPNSMRKTWEGLVARYGFGSFMAGQVVADLRWAITGRWADRRRWAPIGPGSMRGMNILLGRELNHHLPQKEFLSELTNVIVKASQKLPKALTRRLECMDWQNCLCEVSGYEKVLWNRGRKKQLYPGI